MHGRCAVSIPEMSVANSGVKLVLKSETDVLEVAESYMTCFQHLRHAPSTVLPAGSMKEEVGLLHQILTSKTTALAFRAAFFVPMLLVISHPVRPCRARSTVLIRGPNHAYKM